MRASVDDPSMSRAEAPVVELIEMAQEPIPVDVESQNIERRPTGTTYEGFNLGITQAWSWDHDVLRIRANI